MAKHLLIITKYFIKCTSLIIFFILTNYINIVIWSQQLITTKIESINYEYIIVGSGTAGSSIMAGINSSSVLLIEAGVYHPSLPFDIPILTPSLHYSGFSWKHYTTSQKYACFGLQQNRSFWPHGKVFGGSHVLNNMIYYRGDPEDYRGWFDEPENYDYDKDILPYFLKSEKYLKINKLHRSTKLGKYLIQAGNELFKDGWFSKPNLTQHNGRRWTFGHYIYDHLKPGQVILTNSLVTKILFNENKAIGVEYYSKGLYFNVFAEKGVILSAGTIETPKLLMLSGIGPNEELEQFHIKTKMNLPVGLNLQDHVTTGLDILLLDSFLETSLPKLISVPALYEYFMHGKGMLTHSGCDALGILPNITYLVLSVGISSDGGTHLRKIINIDDYLWNNYFKTFVGHSVASVLPILNHPMSRGWIKLKSRSPFDSPMINPNYLSHPKDVEMLVKALHALNHLLNVEPKIDLKIELNPKSIPQCKHLPFNSVKYWECYVRHLTMTMFHPVGTCRLGSTPNNSVISNQNFQVHGITNLYIVDGSILPNLPTGFPNAAIGMLAQRFLKTLK